MNKLTFDEIDANLKGLLEDENVDWIKIGMVLSEVREERYWSTTFGSFSKWLETWGKEINLGKATLWRYITAQEKYERLRDEALEYGYSFPLIIQLECPISPEGIEIFDKLSRVLEGNEVYEMMNGFIEGEITRKELREKWNVFKPALEGKTARGLFGTTAPKIDKANIQQNHFMEESIILDALRLKGIQWLSKGKTDKRTGKVTYPSPSFFKFFQDVKVANHQNHQLYAIDAILGLQKNDGAPLYIHGVEVAGMCFQGNEKIEFYRRYCNAFWVAIPEKFAEEAYQHIPQGVGLVTVNNKKVKVLIQAEVNDSPELLVDTLKELLARWKTA